MSERRARAIYWTLFAFETAGILRLLAIGIPLYRMLLSGPGGDRPGEPFFWKILPLVVGLQVSYWIRRRFASSIRLPHSAVGGHLLLFVSRLTFVFAGSCFSVVFFVRSQDTSGSPHGITVFLVALFALFCYVLALERLAHLCLGDERGGGNEEPPGA